MHKYVPSPTAFFLLQKKNSAPPPPPPNAVVHPVTKTRVFLWRLPVCFTGSDRTASSAKQRGRQPGERTPLSPIPSARRTQDPDQYSRVSVSEGNYTASSVFHCCQLVPLWQGTGRAGQCPNWSLDLLLQERYLLLPTDNADVVLAWQHTIPGA